MSEITMTQVRVETSRVLMYLFHLGLGFSEIEKLAGVVGMGVFLTDDQLIFQIPAIEGEDLPTCDSLKVIARTDSGRLQ